MRSRRILVSVLLLAGCGSPEEPQDSGRRSVSVVIPAAQPYRPDGETMTVVDPEPGAPATRPRLDGITGVCMGQWRSQYSRRGGSIALTMDRRGTYAISGAVTRSGSWRVQGRDIRLGGDRLYECGRTVAHLTIGEQEYSLRRSR